MRAVETLSSVTFRFMFVTVAFQSISQSDYCGRLINQWLFGTSAGCFSVWCFPCFACITARDHGECLCLPLLDSCGCIPPITLSMRVSTRRRYGITVRTKQQQQKNQSFFLLQQLNQSSLLYLIRGNKSNSITL